MKTIMMNVRVCVVTVVALMALVGCAGLYIKYSAFVVDGLTYSIVEDTETVEVYKMHEQINEDGTVFIPNTVLFSGITYTVVGIMPVAFYDCISITQLYLPENIANIGNGAFEGCKSLSAIHCLAVVPPAIGKSTFDETMYDTVILYVPFPAIYKEVEGWNRFKRIEAIQ